MNPKIYFTIGYAAFLMLSSCQTQNEALAKGAALAERRLYQQAYQTVAQELQAYPDDPEIQRMFWELRLEYLLELGWEQIFNERELQAMESFGKALGLDPDNSRARAGIARAKEKLAKEAVREAGALQLEGDLEGALKLLNKATAFIPEYGPAVAGITSITGRYQDRAEKASGRYNLGSRASGELQWRQTYYQTGLALDLDPSLERAKKLHEKSGRRLAMETFQEAREMEANGLYAAALMDYTGIAEGWPDTQGLAERIETVGREVKAKELSRQAAMLTRKKEFDKADELLSEAFTLSDSEKAEVSGLMLENKIGRYEVEYHRAQDFELEQQFEAALEAYRAIDAVWVNGFLDVKTRISYLSAAVEEATKAWQRGLKAEEQGDTEVAIDAYEEALLLYPGFKDLEERLKKLRTGD